MSHLWKSALCLEVLSPNDYRRAKNLLNKGDHPTFIGRDMFATCATNGGALMWTVSDEDAALWLIKTRKSAGIALCVLPKFRGLGLGTHVVDFCKLNFIRSTEAAVPWFEKRGYVAVGKAKQGRSLRTQIMVRANLLTLAGRLRDRLESAKAQAHEKTKEGHKEDRHRR